MSSKDIINAVFLKKMAALGMNSTRNSPSVNILPAQRSLVIADSKYRKRNKSKDSQGNIVQDETNDESPYNFQAYFSSALVGKEVIYQKLYWNQPIYAHTNASSELRFQINGDDSVTYVVYAVPFVMYSEYDGNPPGIPWGVPKNFSYAAMMELGFNGDVRLLNSNLQLTIPPPPATQFGYLYDAGGFQMTVYFRYSPVQGFSISFAQSINPNIPVYTIRILPCTYISEAHFVHGFGIYDALISESEFVPRQNWTVAYFSDDTPNLLPFRYITIRSAELTKDRRMISFQNANSNRFNNELAIIALSPVYTGTYHTENVGDDATVISKRDDYQPSVVRLIISDELGFPILCDSPISNLLQTPYIVNDAVKNSFLFSPQYGRGNAVFVNDILFGVHSNFYTPISTSALVSLAQSTVASPLGVIGYNSNVFFEGPVVGSQKNMSTNFWTWFNSSASTALPNPAYQGIYRQSIPIICNPTAGPVSFSAFPDSETYAGFNSNVVSQNPFQLYGSISNNPVPPEVSVFTWDPAKNPNPQVSVDAHLYPFFFVGGGDITQFGSVYVFIIAYSYDLQDLVLASNAITGMSFNPGFVGIDLYSSVHQQLYVNPNYSSVTDVQKLAFYFTFQNAAFAPVTIPNTVGVAKVAMDFATAFPPPVPIFSISNPTLSNQIEYFPPATNVDRDAEYEFGNPQAAAKCEELIHEFVLVLDKN